VVTERVILFFNVAGRNAVRVRHTRNNRALRFSLSAFALEANGERAGVRCQNSAFPTAVRRRNLSTLEKPNDDYYLTKTILRSYGYGLHRKPLIFQARQRTDRARPNGRGLACFFDRRLAVPRCRARRVRASSF
jgi:hypothetical protein